MKRAFHLFFPALLLMFLISGCFILRKNRQDEVTDHKYITATSPDSLQALDTDTLIRQEPDTLPGDLADTFTMVQVDTSIVADTLQIIPGPADSLAVTIPDTITLIMAGDVMLGTDYPHAGYLPPGRDCWPLISSLTEQISDADISFCNLEGVFAGKKGSPKSCRDPKTCYVFRMPEAYSSCIKEAGFDIVSVANNHVNDFGYGGRMNTIRVLNDAGIHFAGFEEHPYTIFESEGLLIGFCAFSPNQGVLDLRDITRAKNIVSFLSDTCHLVLVSMHGGAEGSNHQHVTRKREMFLGADRGNVYEFAHSMIDAGADVIIGHGPHVTRAVELYEGRFIAYSLGNFATYGRFNISGPNGIAPLIKIWITNDGQFIKGKVVPTMQTGEGVARIDPEKRVIYKLQALIRSDFPDAEIWVTDDGTILRNIAR